MLEFSSERNSHSLVLRNVITAYLFFFCYTVIAYSKFWFISFLLLLWYKKYELWCNGSYAATWSDKNKDKDRRMSGSVTNQLPSSKDYLADFLVWKPPVGLGKSRAFWVGLTIWLGLVGTALFIQRWSTVIYKVRVLQVIYTF